MTAIQRITNAAWRVVKRAGLTSSVTYNARTAQGASPTATTIDVVFEALRDNAIDAVEVLRSDKQIRVRKTDLTVDPTRWDTVVEADGTTWRVMDVMRGETGRPFWLLQGRQTA